MMLCVHNPDSSDLFRGVVKSVRASGGGVGGYSSGS